MTLLYPLGLLGLISLIVLLIIYIIKPNYQQKFISSTFMWRMSLKYRKKKIPMSKLRNILLIICQVLALTACAIILAQPNQIIKTREEAKEIVVIIDSSASMRTTLDQQTRFSRAVAMAEQRMLQTMEEGGIVSLIVADHAPSTLVSRAKQDDLVSIQTALEPLKTADYCSFDEADIDGALALSKEVLEENPDAVIYLYTDVAYASVPEGVIIESARDQNNEEWNAGILDVRVEKEENFCTFYVDVACYGQAKDIMVSLNVMGANHTGTDPGTYVSLSNRGFCQAGRVKTFKFIYEGIYEENPAESQDVIISLIEDKDKIFSYKSVNVFIDTMDDCFVDDNYFNVYGGKKQILNVQYASSMPNPFYPNVLSVVESAYTDVWDIEITEVKKGGEYQTEGFDLYIFEHMMPDRMPTDGVVFFANPLQSNEWDVPVGADFEIYQHISLMDELTLFAVPGQENHGLLKNMNLDNITTLFFTQIGYDHNEYEPILYCGAGPMMLLRNDTHIKTVVMPLNLHYSNLPILKEFPLLMYNMIEYFFPVTVEKNLYEVNDTISFNSRGESLTVKKGTTVIKECTEFPGTITPSLPGGYDLSYTVTLNGKPITEQIYVRIPAGESNIFKQELTMLNPRAQEDEKDYLKDLLLYLAAGLVAVLFIEWFLQSRDNG